MGAGTAGRPGAGKKTAATRYGGSSQTTGTSSKGGMPPKPRKKSGTKPQK